MLWLTYLHLPHYEDFRIEIDVMQLKFKRYGSKPIKTKK